MSNIASMDNEPQNQLEPIAQQNTTDQLKKIRSALRALRDAVILLNEDDSLEWWNQSAQELLSLQPDDKDKSIFDFIRVPEFRQYYQATTTFNDSVHIESWQDPKRYLKCELTPFGDEKLLIIYDVTRLQHLEEMRRDFVANVSHELRTPLTVMMGYLENFSDQPDMPPHWRRGFELMTQQTARMNRIVNDLLLLSRIEIEETHELNYIDMTRLLTNIYDDAQAYNQAYGHTIHLQIDTYDGLYGSEMYLNSALSNLVINAIKYTPKGGNIAISWTKTADGCRFAVEDNGIGIAPEHITRLTERFYRVDKGRSRATGGTGLGLAIVKHVLYQHEANLQIESVEGVGSTFSMVFPAAYVRSASTD
ncbi:phosphate regulon sensor histidine kinase PhoR [Psychrobacter aquaticus]|uniref:Phosphate regulon sensor protein PhoR n=1 Tax=Psychrobacter aquaticus CMS 56 TaxID=1354303 RepID=U4TA23_9GAMM|nr:phosphate regulon sensor histidine kinase PhoR [Psychrobacter aquaticus]ERL55544.1 Phosphate regulon sensor protein PhoR (SphS) [Psychrobacter aquaticus CMS 56]